jgi:hypothetical protein
MRSRRYRQMPRNVDRNDSKMANVIERFDNYNSTKGLGHGKVLSAQRVQSSNRVTHI